MCGFLISNLNFNTSKLSHVMSHRGPDDTGTFQNEKVRMVFNRLSIIDLNVRSNQPLKKGNKLINFNGEIYNYIELRNELQKKGHKFKTNSDTEVLLVAFLEWGEKCLEKLEGMFAFCIYDIEKNTIFAARDRFGIKPLFVYIKNNTYIISSEKKAIFSCGIEKILNRSELTNYLAHGVYQHSTATFFNNIINLEPGSLLKIEKNKYVNKKWFNFKIKELKIDFKEAAQELEKKMNNSINLCLRSDKKISVALSGGLDSSSLAYFINNNQNKNNLENTLVHWTCNDENDEAEFAKKIAEQIGKKLSISNFSKKNFYQYLKKAIISVEEPFGGLNNISAMKMFEKLNKKKLRVIIDGNGADEILGGYSHHIKAYNNNYLDYHSQPVQGLNIKFDRNILSSNLQKEIKKFRIEKFFDNPLKDSMYNDLVGSKLRRSLFQQDHIAMSNSLEMRFPFLNNELVNFCYSLPNSFLVQKNYGKFLLRKIISTNNSMTKKRPLQNPQILWMKKFIIDDLIEEILNNEKLNDFNIFENKYLISKLKYWKRNISSNSIFPWQILMAINFLKFNF